MTAGTDKDTRAVALKLLAYCRENQWAGYDPYDALNSRLVGSLPFLNSKLIRLALTQALRRSPVNLRGLLRVPKTQNPKALALFLSAFLRLPPTLLPDRESLVDEMVDRLRVLRSARISYCAWGYSFPWQGRFLLVPQGAPNLVCTTFVAGALLDLYEQRRDAQCLDMAVSAARYILNELYWESDGAAGFSYPMPSLKTQVHNSNFLGAALFCRVHKHTGDARFLAPALKVARYSAAKQRADGSWYYGEMPSQRWIDNFHTGYNLCALHAIGRDAATTEFEPGLRQGLDFYRAHFFRADGAAKYFHDRTYPIDIHSVAQSIITLAAFRDFDPANVALAHSVLRWALANLWDERGFFYYRVLRSCTIRTPYMRWSEAWMLLAIATLLQESGGKTEEPQGRDAASFARTC
jgi:hypothetical protein